MYTPDGQRKQANPPRVSWTIRNQIARKREKLPRSIKTYVFQVQNFDFERAITVLGCNPNLMANLRSFRIKVCHVMTTATPSTTSFVKWAKFTAKYRKNLGNVNHQVIAAPAPASREDLIRNVFELKELVSTLSNSDLYLYACLRTRHNLTWMQQPNITKVDKVEAENIEAGFAKWWDMGAGKYMWIKDEEIKKMGVDEAAWNKETQELREIGKHQHPDDDDSEEDELVSDSEMDGMDDDMDEDEEDAEDGDEYDSVDESD